MYNDAITISEAERELHGKAMCCGWAIAIEKMKEQQMVKEVMRLWPGAKVIAVRGKEAKDPK